MEPSDRKNLVELDRDHPGFRDAHYRRRRDEIARMALDHRDGSPVPAVAYTDEEQGVWRAVWQKLGPVHESLAVREYRTALSHAELPRDRVPQFAEVNPRLMQCTGFELIPVAGLVSPRVFLEYLGRGQFLATQYMRHHSRPLYTPEPDVIHELVGHAATLGDPLFADLNRAFGVALCAADDARERALINLYWWTVEFGLAREDGRIKAYGAGLLSSYGELGRFADNAELRPFVIDHMVALDFDPTDYQRTLFVAESFAAARAELLAWLAAT